MTIENFALAAISWSGWEIIEFFLTAVGAFSLGLAAIRVAHDSRQKKWSNNVSIQDYVFDYEVESKERNVIYSELWTQTPDEYMMTIVFKPVDCIIPKLKIISLDLDGKEKKVIGKYKNITPNEAVCFRLERAECIPKFKLKWYSDFGEYGEYYFDENLRNGINSVDGIVYNATLLSTIRRILNLR